MDTSKLIVLFATIFALFVNTGTLIAIYFQTLAATRQLKANAHQALTASWLSVGIHEMAEPDLHKILMGPRSTRVTSGFSAQQLQRRAFVHMVMDVISQKMRVEKATTGRYPDTADIAFANPEFCKMWKEFEVREAFDGDPLQPVYDKLANQTLTSNPA